MCGPRPSGQVQFALLSLQACMKMGCCDKNSLSSTVTVCQVCSTGRAHLIAQQPSMKRSATRVETGFELLHALQYLSPERVEAAVFQTCCQVSHCKLSTRQADFSVSSFLQGGRSSTKGRGKPAAACAEG